MTSTARIQPAPITGVFGAMVKRFSKNLLGEVPEPVGVYFHNRPVLKAFLAVSSKAQKWSACDENLKSFAHMAVAAQVGCSWCLDFGYFQAHNEGLDEAKASQVPVWRTSDAFTPLEREVLEFAEAMTVTPPTVTDDQFASLLSQLGEPAMVELTTQIALANLYTRSNVAMGIESQGFSDACDVKLAVPHLSSRS
ncbi:MAG TPA: carboxymuconolactone decarboxylase family protein [Propionibacteriaceae bacterium]|nr:carboxymuconolactone decarboxylase family protein [Propionibacteriaceae bacterium]